MAFNLVEFIQEPESDCAFDQRCKFGHRVEDHAVYCHHDDWGDSPRKCRRSWYTDGRIKDEDCPGFELNPEFQGDVIPSAAKEPTCSRCRGAKIIKTEHSKRETCPLCMGSGSQPTAIPLTQFEQDTLELGTSHDGRRGTAGHAFVRIARNAAERKSINKLCSLDLIVIRSISGGLAYMLENTLKGEAVMRCNWEAAKTTNGTA